MKAGIKKKNVNRLLKLAQNGNQQAFSRLYKIYYPKIYRYILIRIGDKYDSEDLTSELFKKIWVNISFIECTNVRAYLYTVARNLVIDYYRKNKHPKLAINDFPILDKSTGLEQMIKAIDDEIFLKKALKCLSSNYSQVIKLRFLDDLSVNETAKIMNTSLIAVRVTQHKAMRILKRLLLYAG